MKILCFNDAYIPQKFRGTEINTHALARLLNGLGHEVAILCGLEPRGLHSLWSRLKLRLPTRSDMVRDRVAGDRIYRAWLPAQVLDRVIERERPDVVLVQTTDPRLIEAASRLDMPVCVYSHNIPDMEHLPPFRRAIHITNSRYCQEQMARRFGIRSSVIRPVVLPADYRTKVDRREITSFGLSHDKGADIVLRLAAMLPDLPFRIFANQGNGPARDKVLAERAAALPNVTVSPPVRSGRQVYRRTRVVLAPSRFEETWGRMATEAHVNDIPVLSSDRGGLSEAVGAGGERLSLDAPIEAWRDTLRRMYEDPAPYRDAIRAHRDSSLIHPDAIGRDLVKALERCIAET